MKPGGLLEKAMRRNDETGICKSCRNLVQVSETALGCVAHDKLIMPDYPPYHGNTKCKDWKEESACTG